MGMCDSHRGGVFTLVCICMDEGVCVCTCVSWVPQLYFLSIYCRHTFACLSQHACLHHKLPALSLASVIWLRASVRGWCTIPADFYTLECVCVSVDLPLGVCVLIMQTVSGWCRMGKDGAVPQKWKGAVNESLEHFRTPPQFLSCPLRFTQHSHGLALLKPCDSDSLLCYVMMY